MALTDDDRERAEALAKRVTVGIVTALPEERAAMLAMLDRTVSWSVSGRGAGLVYDLGELPAYNGGCHVVAVALADMGNNIAAARGTLLLGHFPEIEAIVMVGIAGGVPNAAKADDHVRLGDVVVSDRLGVIQYDFVKKTRTVTQERASPRPPHARLLEAVRLLEADALAGARPWEAFTERAKHLQGGSRPNPAGDVLLASRKPFSPLKHPADPKRAEGQPRIFRGPIASGNALLKDPVWRDRLRDQHGVKAVEMEASGIADATWVHGVGYLVVRGICDYCDSNKNDAWHVYAAIVAAAYTRALLGRVTLAFNPDQKAAHKLLVDRSDVLDAGDYEKAIALGEEAVRLARKAGDREELTLALRCVIVDITDWLALEGRDRQKRTKLLQRIRAHLEEFESLGPPRTQLFLEKASLAQLEGRQEDALRHAEAAIREADNIDTEAEATLFCLRASWHGGLEERGLLLRDRVHSLIARISSKEMKLMLGADWLSTLCRAGKATMPDIEQFTAQIRDCVGSKKVLGIVSKVVSDFGRIGSPDAVRALLLAAMDVAVTLDDAATVANIVLEIAQVEAELGNAAVAIQQLGLARGWVEKLRPAKGGWVIAMVNTLRASGDVYSLLSSKTETDKGAPAIQYQRKAYEALKATQQFVAKHEAEIAGPAEILRAELDARLGKVADQLGRHTEAALLFRRARTELVMSDEDLFRAIGAKAFVDEAGALFSGGRVAEAHSLLTEILARPAMPENLRNLAQHNMKVMEKSILPVVNWLASPAARQIGDTVARSGLRAAVAELARPLGEWMDELSASFEGPPPFAELFDQWGRGGFARLVAAVRADPLSAVSVDATSVTDIERMARIFCPLYDTVIVSWKGRLEGRVAYFPVSGASRNCGIGYSLLKWDGGSGLGLGGWANLLPADVATFLGTVARPLVTGGRLVVVPAPLVGSTQSLVGWTDNVLVDHFFGGVVKSVKLDPSPATSATPETTPVRDLGVVRLPVIDGVPLRDLDAMLNDTVEWTVPLRRLLRKALGNDDIRQERWGNVGTEIQELREGLRHLDDKFRVAVEAGGPNARVVQLTGALAAGERLEDCPGAEPLTLFARAIAGAHPELGPWIPFWRLHNIGAAIHWVHPLDNRSTPAPIELVRSRSGIDPNHEGWLYPGEGGPGMRASLRVPIAEGD